MGARDPLNVLAALWRAAGHNDAALGAVKLTGGEPQGAEVRLTRFSD